MNIATAGHVDHGKTSLVRALTLVDTDRLAEEKRRGMSIDLGFAYADFGADAPVGFIDVPGHERFVRNMLAGVACIDLALIVIAADDGPMPQTREHLAILELLGVPQAVVALTKIDRVGPERLAQAKAEVAQLLAPGPFHNAPLFPVVSTDGTGLPALRECLTQAARCPCTRTESATGFRLAVDRSFTLAGAGRVVTGAVLSGTVRIGDAVTLSPAGTTARVRGIHAQGREAEQATIGERCSLNLAGSDLRHALPVRGDWVVTPALHAPTQRLDAEVKWLATETDVLAERAGLQLHIGAAAVGVRVSPLGVHGDDAAVPARTIAPGQIGYAHLSLDQPIGALHGDRFILRDAAHQRTVGGGRVLDPFAPPRVRDRGMRLLQLTALALPTPTAALQALIERQVSGIDIDRFAQAWNLDAVVLASVLSALTAHHIAQASRDAPRRLLSLAHWQTLRGHVQAALADYHQQTPDSLGPTEPVLLTNLQRQQRELPRSLLRAALLALIGEDAVQRTGLRVRLAEHQPVLAPADDELLKRVAALLQVAGLRAPIVGDLATQLALELPALLQFLQHANDLGRLLRVAPNRYYLPETVAELATLTARLAAKSDTGSFDTAAFRDASGIGRNLSVQVLEFMDQAGFTRFDGTHRRPVG